MPCERWSKDSHLSDIILKSGRDRSVRQRHPWIFSGSVGNLSGNPSAGESVRVFSAAGEPLGWAAYSPASQIRARMWSFDPDDVIDDGFFHKRLKRAIQRRSQYQDYAITNAYRLVHGESDGLPGLIVDRYNEHLVVQLLSAGSEYQRDILIDLLVKTSEVPNVYERSDLDMRALEGLPMRNGVLRGILPPERLVIHENGLQFLVDPVHGQKTGFYLDQRDNRQRVRAYAQNAKALNCFAYTGGFCVYSLAAGASSVLNVDSSAEVLALAKENILLNDQSIARTDWIVGDVFQELRKLRDRAESFDLIILDPPKFAATTAQVDKAARGYKDINLLSFKLLKPGGVLFTFSCSGGVSPDLFQKIVAGAALDAGVHAVILEKLDQASDHPIALNFPEGEYLKGLVCQI
jgi:23S rRNA (cytosine1962-C5)-methyltransferase